MGPQGTRLTAALTGAILALALLGPAAEAKGHGGGGPHDRGPDQGHAQTCAEAAAQPGTAPASALNGAVLCLLNRERAQHGLAQLKSNPRLASAAARHAQDMVSHSYFAHDSLDGSNFVDRIVRAGYVRRKGAWTLGENLAWGTGALASPSAIVDGWMRSPGHRANVLAPSFREIGIAIAAGVPVAGEGEGATYATDYGRRY